MTTVSILEPGKNNFQNAFFVMSLAHQKAAKKRLCFLNEAEIFQFE